jgi:hypothetical protein
MTVRKKRSISLIITVILLILVSITLLATSYVLFVKDKQPDDLPFNISSDSIVISNSIPSAVPFSKADLEKSYNKVILDARTYYNSNEDSYYLFTMEGIKIKDCRGIYYVDGNKVQLPYTTFLKQGEKITITRGGNVPVANYFCLKYQEGLNVENAITFKDFNATCIKIPYTWEGNITLNITAERAGQYTFLRGFFLNIPQGVKAFIIDSDHIRLIDNSSLDNYKNLYYTTYFEKERKSVFYIKKNSLLLYSGNLAIDGLTPLTRTEGGLTIALVPEKGFYNITTSSKVLAFSSNPIQKSDIGLAKTAVFYQVQDQIENKVVLVDPDDVKSATDLNKKGINNSQLFLDYNGENTNDPLTPFDNFKEETKISWPDAFLREYNRATIRGQCILFRSKCLEYYYDNYLITTIDKKFKKSIDTLPNKISLQTIQYTSQDNPILRGIKGSVYSLLSLCFLDNLTLNCGGVSIDINPQTKDIKYLDTSLSDSSVPVIKSKILTFQPGDTINLQSDEKIVPLDERTIMVSFNDKGGEKIVKLNIGDLQKIYAVKGKNYYTEITTQPFYDTNLILQTSNGYYGVVLTGGDKYSIDSYGGAVYIHFYAKDSLSSTLKITKLNSVDLEDYWNQMSKNIYTLKFLGKNNINAPTWEEVEKVLDNIKTKELVILYDESSLEKLENYFGIKIRDGKTVNLNGRKVIFKFY